MTATFSTQVSDYASQIMTLIDEDIAAGLVPASAASFTELHDHVDANGYYPDAGLADDGTDEALDLINAVAGEVSQRLAARVR